MNTLVAISFALGVSAFTVPRSSCFFELTASGGESGTIGQLSDGQNRIGGGMSAANFTISNGGITDAAGRGCILTPSVEQFQCDQGVGPTYGFAIDSNGTVTSSGSSTFYACPASDTEWNLYTIPVAGQDKCVEISLTASGCGTTTSSVQMTTTVTISDCGKASSASGAATLSKLATTQLGSSTSTLAPSSVAITFPSSSDTTEVEYSTKIPTAISIANTATTSSEIAESEFSTAIPTALPITTAVASSSTILPSSIATSIQSSSSSCATTLTGSSTSGNYQYPHLIIPISSSSPEAAAGTSYFGTISSNTSTILNFDIPSSYSGSTCSLIFLLPLQSELETSSYTLSGTGGIEIEELSSAATTSTTWENAPSVANDLGEFTLTEGSSTLVQSFACPAGQTLTYEMSAVGDTYLYYFQDWNPSPLGLYMTVC